MKLFSDEDLINYVLQVALKNYSIVDAKKKYTDKFFCINLFMPYPHFLTIFHIEVLLVIRNKYDQYILL